MDGMDLEAQKDPLGYHRNYDMGWLGLGWTGLGWGAFRLLFSINETTAIIEQGERRKGLRLRIGKIKVKGGGCYGKYLYRVHHDNFMI